MKPYFYPFLYFILLSVNSFAQIDSANAYYQKYKQAEEENRNGETKRYLINVINKNFQVQGSYYGFVHNKLGLMYWKLGNIDSAEFHYLKAEEYCVGTTKSIKYLKNSIYNNLALLFVQEERLPIALNYYEQSENILFDVSETDELFFNRLSALYLNRGIAYYKLGNLDYSLESLNKAHKLKTKYNLSYLGSVYFNLARVHQDLENFNLAKVFYQKSIIQWTRELGPDNYRLAGVYLDYGQLLLRKMNDSQGLFFYENSLSIYIQQYGPQHPYTSDCYEHIARYYLAQEEYLKALKNVQQAIISICPTYEDSNLLSNPSGQKALIDINFLRNLRTKVQALRGLPMTYGESIIIEGNIYSKEDILKFALGSIELEIELLHKIQNRYIDQESRLFLDENQKDIFIDGIEISKQLYDITKDEKYLNQAYRIASIGKSLEFQFEFAEKQKLYLESLTSPLAETILDLKEDIASYQNTVRLEQQKLSPDSSLILVWSDSLFNLKRSYKKKTEELLGKADSSEYWRNEIDENHLVSTQKKLQRNETLIEYSLSNNSTEGIRRMYTFVITKNDCKILESELNSSFNHNIETVNRHLQTYDLAEYSTEKYDTLVHSLNYLYQELILPINEWISGDHLIIIPDEELYLIPFDALIRGNIKDLNTQSIDQHYLLKDYYISYAINSQFFKKRKSTIFHSPDVLAIGETSLIKDDDSIIKLNAIEEEFNAIFKEYKGQQITQDIGKVELLNMIEGNKILHFAMHSYSEDHALSSAYIQLDPVDDSIYSNRLFDYEISSIRLSSPMVVLSSCESGSGTLYSGEGVMSLSRSFLLAGSESVVHTLWPVEDKSSSQIIIDYYKGLKKGWNKSKALQKAKIKYLENASPTFYNPHFWAGFQVTGNIQRISTSPIIIIGCVAGGVLFASCILFWIIRKRKN